MFSSSSAPPWANLKESTCQSEYTQEHRVMLNSVVGEVKLPLIITNSQSPLKSCTNAIFHDYLEVSRRCWSWWFGSMCCQWRPPSGGDTPLTLSLLPHLGSLTLGPLHCVWHHEPRHFSASLGRVHQRSHVTCCQSCQANTESCLALWLPVDQGTPTLPGESRQTRFRVEHNHTNPE